MVLPFRLGAGAGGPRLGAVALAAVGGSFAVHGLAFAWVLARDQATPTVPPNPIPLSLVAVQEEGPSILAAPAAAPPPAVTRPTPARPPVRAVPRPVPSAPPERPVAIAEAPAPPTSAEGDPAAAPVEVSALTPTPLGGSSGGATGGGRHVFGEGEVDRAARPALRIRPRYPERARVMGRESDVRMAVTVEADGVVSAVELVQSGGDEFDREARLALERSRFEPAHKAGTPVAAIVTFTVRFRLDPK